MVNLITAKHYFEGFPEFMIQQEEYLFVYGTLMSSITHPMSEYLSSNANLVGKGCIAGKLYDLGEYPGLIGTEDKKSQVFGEIFDICGKVALLRRIDEYEGCGKTQPKPHLYERRSVSVKLTSEQDIMAWTYFYLGNTRTHKCIEGGDYAAYVNASSKRARFIKAR